MPPIEMSLLRTCFNNQFMIFRGDVNQFKQLMQRFVNKSNKPIPYAIYRSPNAASDIFHWAKDIYEDKDCSLKNDELAELVGFTRTITIVIHPQSKPSLRVIK